MDFIKPSSQMLLVACAYYLIGRLGLSIPLIGTHITLFWLPTGIAVAALFRWGYFCWPGVAVGALLVDLATGASFSLSAGIAIGSTLGPILSVWILRRNRFHAAFEGYRDIISLTLAAALGMAVSAGNGVLMLWLNGAIPSQGALAALGSWWLGDFVGILLATPLLTTIDFAALGVLRKRHQEFLLWCVLAGLLGWTVFLTSETEGLPLTYLPLLLTVWAAMRFGLVGGQFAVVFLSLMSAIGTSFGAGPFHVSLKGYELLYLWGYMVALALVSLMVTALLADRKKVEVALQESETRLRALLDTTAIGIVVIDEKGVIEDFNPGSEQLFGYAKSEAVGNNINILMPEPFHSVHDQSIKNYLTGQPPKVIGSGREVVGLHKSGSAFPMDLYVGEVLFQNRRAFVGFVQNVTERKKLIGHLQRWLDIFEFADWGIAVGSADTTTIELMNPAFARMLGYTVEELTGQPILSVFAPESRGDFAGHAQRAHEQGHYVFEAVHIRKNGTKFSVEVDITVVYGSAGEVLYRVVNLKDITQRKQAENLLRISEANLRRAQAVSETGSWFLDVRNNILTWSDESYRIFGIIHGTPLTYEIFLSAVYPRDREYVDAKWNAALKGEMYDIEHRIIVNCEVRWVRERAELEFDSDGVLIGGIGTVQDITELKMIRDAINQSEARLSEAERIAHLGSWEWDIATGEQIWSEETYRIFGLKKGVDMASYDQFMSLIFDEDKPLILQGVEAALREDFPYRVEYRIRYRNGSTRYVQSQAVVHRAADGTPVRMVGTNLDVTVLFEAQRRLTLSEASLKAMYDNLPFMAWMKDLDGRYIQGNKPWLESLNFSVLENVVGKTDFDLWPHDLAQHYRDTDHAVIQRREKTKLVEKSLYLGKEHWVETFKAPVIDQGGQVIGTLGLARDVTEEKQIDELLHQRTEEFRALVEQSPDIVVRFDREYRYVYVNPAIEASSGVPVEMFIGKTLGSLGMSDPMAEHCKKTIASVINDGVGRNHEFSFIAQGMERHFHARVVPERKPHGAVDSVLVLVRDITEIKQVEIALSESRELLRELAADDEATRELERKHIAREIHDELGQTLTALRMDVSLLRIRFGANDPALMEKVQSMTDLVDRAIQSVRDVAANLRPAVLDMGIVSALEWLCDEFTEHTGVPCALQTAAEFFALDEARAIVVFRIVQESLTNAAKYAEAGKVDVILEQRGGDLSVVVVDNGKGFDPTIRTSRKSFGLLGMRERAIALGGDVDIISVPGQGTSISVLIPMEIQDLRHD